VTCQLILANHYTVNSTLVLYYCYINVLKKLPQQTDTVILLQSSKVKTKQVKRQATSDKIDFVNKYTRIFFLRKTSEGEQHCSTGDVQKQEYPKRTLKRKFFTKTNTEITIVINFSYEFCDRTRGFTASSSCMK